MALVELTFPKLLTWSEFLKRLSEIEWYEWLIVTALTVFCVSLCVCSVRRDDRDVVADFVPTWYVTMTKTGPFAAKAAGYRLAMLLTTHKLLSPFFVLPGDVRAKFTQ